METENKAVMSMPVETLKQVNSEKELATITDNQETETTKEPPVVEFAVVNNPVDNLLVSDGLESAVTAADPSSEKEVLKSDEAPLAVRPATPTESSLDPVTLEEAEKVEAAPEPTAPVANAPEKKQHKKPHKNDSFASEDLLDQLQAFLVRQIQEDLCSSNSKDIYEFVTQQLNEKQRKRYVAPLMQRLAQHFRDDATQRGQDEVSVEFQSSICLIEQLFLAMGRVSPLQDMYTAEEEEMLDLIFHNEEPSPEENHPDVVV